MKKLTWVLVLACILAGCSSQNSGSTELENTTEEMGYESNVYDIYLSSTSECKREENPELYCEIEKLLSTRTEMQFAIASPSINLESEDVIKVDDYATYYPLKEAGLTSKEKIREKLMKVYDEAYVDRVLMPYYFEKTTIYLEEENRLYARDTDVVVQEFCEDWVVWKVNGRYYYLQARVDNDTEVMAILTLVRSNVGGRLLISDEVEINYFGREVEQNEMAEIEGSTKKRTMVSGSFTVGVRDVIPDYVLDSWTPCIVIATEFQSYPFTLFVRGEIGEELQVGEQYVFTIEPIVVDYSVEELKQMELSSLVWELPGFYITDARLAEDGELGLASLQLTFAECGPEEEVESIWVYETNQYQAYKQMKSLIENSDVQNASLVKEGMEEGREFQLYEIENVSVKAQIAEDFTSKYTILIDKKEINDFQISSGGELRRIKVSYVDITEDSEKDVVIVGEPPRGTRAGSHWIYAYDIKNDCCIEIFENGKKLTDLQISQLEELLSKEFYELFPNFMGADVTFGEQHVDKFGNIYYEIAIFEEDNKNTGNMIIFFTYNKEMKRFDVTDMMYMPFYVFEV